MSNQTNVPVVNDRIARRAAQLAAIRQREQAASRVARRTPRDDQRVEDYLTYLAAQGGSVRIQTLGKGR